MYNEEFTKNGCHCPPQSSVPSSSPQVNAGRPKRMSDLVRESGVLELEMATIQQRLAEINEQMRELAGTCVVCHKQIMGHCGIGAGVSAIAPQVYPAVQSVGCKMKLWILRMKALTASPSTLNWF